MAAHPQVLCGTALSLQHHWWDILLVALQKAVARSPYISKHVGYAYPEKSLRLLALSSVVARGPLRGCFERVDVKGSLTAQKLFEVQVLRCG